MKKLKSYWHHCAICLLVVIALIPRLHRIDNPIADWHAFRQADTASVTREYVKHGIEWLVPRYHDLSNIQSGLDNIAGYRMVEFPLVNGLLAILLRAVPALPLVITSRLTSVLASIGALLFLYGFVKTVSNNKPLAWLSGLFFALMPYSIYYSRVVLPEPYLLLFSLGSLYYFVTALGQKSVFLDWRIWASALLLSVSFLLKPFVVFLAPLYAVLLWRHRSKKQLLSPFWLVWLCLIIIPFIWWRNWIQQFPSGIPAADWLLNSDQIRFRPAWFRWLFYERMTKLFLGYTGIILIGATLIWSKTKLRNLLIAWGVGLLAYISVFATGNVRHDYYQVIFIPLVSIGLGAGTYYLWQKLSAHFAKDVLLKKTSQAAVVLLSLLTIVLPWKAIKGYFNVNHWEYVEAGQAVDELVPATAKVIAPAFGDTHFLFQTNRTGWPIGFEIEDKIQKGATHYVTTNYDDEARELEKLYNVLEKNDRFMIIELTSPAAERAL